MTDAPNAGPCCGTAQAAAVAALSVAGGGCCG